MRKLDDLDLHPAHKAQLQRQQDRMAKIKEGQQRPRVRVVPKNDELRKALFHPWTRMRFPAKGSAEWPHDQFTKRRIRDGDVTVEEERRNERAQSTPPVPRTE
jgi:hypothetical protein